jgi:hypothetical protein
VAGRKRACADFSAGPWRSTVRSAFSEGMTGIYRSDGPQPGLGYRFRSGPHLAKNATEVRALLIVRDEFRVDYSLIGVLASRARLRFIDRSSLSGDLRLGRRNRTFLLCQNADISTLP